MKARPVRWPLLLALSFLAGASQANDPVEISTTPLFMGGKGAPSLARVLPLDIRLTNHLENPAEVSVRISTPVSHITYPVRVDAREDRSFTAYATFPSVPGVEVEMSAISRGSDGKSSTIATTPQRTLIDANPDGPAVLLLGGNNEDYMALGPDSDMSAHGSPGVSMHTLPTTFKPGTGQVKIRYSLFRLALGLPLLRAPDRPIGYWPFEAVVLGPRAKNLTDGAVNALKEYAIAGGQIIFESRPGDPRWQSLIPPGPGRNALGLGRVVVLPGNPAINLHAAEVLDNDISYPPDSLDSYASTLMQNNPSFVAQGGVAVDPKNDPFAATLPSFGKVLGVLIAYFLMVVPANFLLLKKLRRPELTWITAPAIGIIFAGVLFGGSKALYNAPASHATRGALIVQEGISNGVFVGMSELFLPHGGAIDLKLTDVDHIQAVNFQPQPFANGNQIMSASLPPQVDTGSVEVPAMRTTNLAFKQIGLTQRVPAKDWFAFQEGPPNADGVRPITVKNSSPYALKNAKLIAGIFSIDGFDLQPGQTSPVLGVTRADDLEAPQDFNSGRSQDNQDLPSYAEKNRRIMIVGEADDVPVGSATGRRIPARTTIMLAAFARPDLVLPK